MERNQYIQPLHYGNVCIGFDSRSLVLFSFRGRFKRQMYVIQMDHKCIDLVFDSSECVLYDNSCLNHLSFAVCLTVLQWGFFWGVFFGVLEFTDVQRDCLCLAQGSYCALPASRLEILHPHQKGKKNRQTARPCTELSNSWLLRQSCRCKKARIKLDTLRTDEGERGRDETDKHSLRGRGDRLSPCLITVTAAKKTPQEQLTNQC